MIQEVKNIATVQTIHQNKHDLNDARVIQNEDEVTQNERKISMEEVEKIIKELNQFIQIFNTKITFEIDKEARKTVLKIVDVETNEIIRQIPPKELLIISKRISELLGLIINEKV
ncbi:MAG: flagellar protein FlaG [Candidatus Kryptonium sp.]|nr:flagellar protein FlaG [Candidatus Kryptonium sp.]MDW8108273.1 flagellar protein FlaG [Candidatus Kryptonium sp.]